MYGVEACHFTSKKFCVMAIWDSEEIVLIDMDMATATLIQEPTMLIWLENVDRHWKRRDFHCCVLFCTSTLYNAPAHTFIHKHRVPSELLHHPTYSPDLALVTSISIKNWSNSWKYGNCSRWGCYSHFKWLAGGPRSRILLQWNSSIGKTVHGPVCAFILKSNKK